MGVRMWVVKYELCKLRLTPGKMVELLGEYKKSTKFETFSGFLHFVGLTPQFMREMSIAIGNDNDNYIKVGKFLENYKMELEVRMEEYLLYQGAHDDLKDVKNYNYGYLQFLLKASNPMKYGDKKINIDTGGKDTKVGDVKILENKSGIKLGDK